jgi:hypothetical protein
VALTEVGGNIEAGGGRLTVSQFDEYGSRNGGDGFHDGYLR